MEKDNSINSLNQTVIDDTVSVSEQPKTNNFLTILLSVLLIISVAISGFFAVQTQKLVKELNVLKTQEKTINTSSSEPVPTSSSAIADPAESWKTYSNSKYGFSFKYPSNFEDMGFVAGPYSINSSKSVVIRSFSDPLTIVEGTDAPFDGFSLYYVDNLNAASFDEFLLNEKTTMDNAEYASMTGSKRIPLDNNGVAFINETRGYYYYPLDGGKHSLVFAYIQKNNSFRTVFNQIISTFKFLD